MGHFSDSMHMETCANKFCNVMDTRSNMRKIEGKRGWWCLYCYEKKKPKKSQV